MPTDTDITPPNVSICDKAVFSFFMEIWVQWKCLVVSWQYHENSVAMWTPLKAFFLLSLMQTVRATSLEKSKKNLC